MSFTSLSAALLLVVAVAVFWGIRRGMRRGLTPTVFTLSAVAVSALAAAPLAVWLSDYPVKAMAELIFRDLIPEIVLINFSLAFSTDARNIIDSC